MTTYTIKQLKDMSAPQLQRLAGELRFEVQNLSFQASTGELKTTHQLGQSRKTLARVLTLLTKTERSA